MIRIGFDPMMEAQQRQRGLLKEVEQYRLIREASQAKDSKARLSFKFLSVIGKEIASFGANLEERFGGSSQSEVVINHNSNPEGCA